MNDLINIIFERPKVYPTQQSSSPSSSTPEIKSSLLNGMEIFIFLLSIFLVNIYLSESSY
jgi:hypothetical protein